MTEADEPDLTVAEFVEYCRTQARLLSGSIQTMGAEADELLDEIDAEMAEIRRLLEEGDGSRERTESPDSADALAENGVDVAAVEERESAIEATQAEVAAKQARMDAFRDLADGYTDLAGELATDAADGQAAMRRVVEFEGERDAPAYFDAETVLEAVAASAEASEE